MDLSVLIPARNEMFLQRTIEDVLAHARADTEVIAVLDGEWPDPPLQDHPRLRVTHSATVLGQRAATNLAARMSTATYVMKLDAHCSVDDGFDVKLIAADREIGRPDVTQIPAMYNLRAFQWKCGACGNETYQGPTPTTCAACEALDKTGGPFERVMYWDRLAGGRKKHIRTEFWRFDHELHFQYWSAYGERPAAHGELVDVMSSIGACFFMRRQRFEEIGGLDEAHGSWGQFGTEIACKSWLSGGRHVVNKRTWFAHLFRTQGGDFTFPYHNPESKIREARAYSRKLWIDGTWPGAQRSLRWLVEKFHPVPEWTPDRVAAIRDPQVVVPDDAGDSELDATQPNGGPVIIAPTKGLIYYSDNRGDPAVLSAVREQLVRAASGLPVVSATLGPVDLGRNLVPRACAICGHLVWVVKRPRRCVSCGATEPPTGHRAVFNTLERGYLTMFRQQLAALEALDTDVAFLCEHDVLYHPSHFEFTPPRRDTFYYNQHTWRVDAESGRALFYYCNQVSGLCADRSLLIDHYRKRVAHVEQYGFERSLGFEPGGNARSCRIFGDVPVETWRSAVPNVDIKTSYSLTPGRWSQDQFRNKSTCQGWQEADAVPGWGMTRGRMAAFLATLGTDMVLEVAS